MSHPIHSLAKLVSVVCRVCLVLLAGAVFAARAAAQIPTHNTPRLPRGTRLFSHRSAHWLYEPPFGTPIDISKVTAQLPVTVLTHDGGWDYPVQYTDGTHGYTTFTDKAIYPWRKERIKVPNPPDGYWPSNGGDHHLVIVDTAHRRYYDFWKLQASNGVPETDTGEVKTGSLDGPGAPGTTATKVSGVAGAILPGELECEICVKHALNVVVPAAMTSPVLGSQGPAVATDGKVDDGIFRENAKIQFDPCVDVGHLQASTAVKALMRALQRYGGLITDQSGGHGLAFYSALPNQPDTTGIDLISKHLLIYY